MPDDLQTQSDDVYYSLLFTVRLWQEQLGESESEWRGKVEHVLSKEARYFRDWSTLINFLQEVLYQQNFLKRYNHSNIQGEEE